MPAVKYIGYVANLNIKDAFVEYLKQAGVWKERTTLKSPPALPAESKADAVHEDVADNSAPAVPALANDVQEFGGEGAPMVAADGSCPSAELDTPHPPADEKLPDEPAESAELEQQPLMAGVIVSREEFEQEEKREWEKLIAQTVELIREEKRASAVRLKQKFQIGQSRANRLLDDLQARGYIGPAVAGEPRRILNLPAPVSSPVTNPSAVVASGANPAAASSTIPGPAATAGPGTGPAIIVPTHDGRRSLKALFERAPFLFRDEEMLFKKRALDTAASRGLRFRSNPKSNRDLLIAIEQEFGFQDCLAAGIWLPEDRRAKKDRRPNGQFYGAGRIRKLKPDESPGRGEWKDDEGNLWGWCEPILIPYFNERGELLSLRPHKGMGRSGTLVGTSQVYFPRPVGSETQPEFFPKVVITEGEFKAAILWRIMAMGRKEPMGVCALPGISFAKNYECRQVLDDWLMQVHCRHVIVGFDNEEKGDPKLASYKKERDNRFDSIIWARYLATDLARKLHIRAEVCILPNAWRNAQGKADWDGRAAQLNEKSWKKAA
ncbi:MAG TPA: DNA translocase FtsK [Verrucomicrobiae bacterium]|nr:DNA translocase FtsK [Verrucomicrobiae bacterium]